MKKFFALLFVSLAATFMFAKEVVWFDASALGNADLEGTSYADWEIKSDSGYFNAKNLFIKAPTDKGLPFIAIVPESATTATYKVIPPFNSGFTEPDSGTGYIDNAGMIRSIKVEGMLNRPYDSIYLLYSETPFGEIKKQKIDTSSVNVMSMVKFETVFENPNYTDDSAKRNIKKSVVVNGYEKGLYLKGFLIETHTPTNGWVYSPYSICYISKITVNVDDAFTEEQIESREANKELFALDETQTLFDKEKKAVILKKSMRDEEAAKMDKGE